MVDTSLDLYSQNASAEEAFKILSPMPTYGNLDPDLFQIKGDQGQKMMT